MLDAQMTPQPVRLADYRPPAWAVPSVELDFDLAPERTRVRARLTVERRGPGPLVLDGQDLELIALRVDGAPHAATPAGEQLVLDLPGDRAVVETEVLI